jgi:hypothetical protein
MCIMVGDEYNEWTCGCNPGYQCTEGCQHPHIGHTCSIETPAPTPVPTPQHECNDNSHGCYKGPGGMCIANGDDFDEWTCGCEQPEFKCVSGCQYPHVAHECALVTQAPTAYPTPAHECNSGNHGCDKGPGGTCIMVGENPDHDSWTCGCLPAYECTDGCQHPHIGHNCSIITPAPTPAPTPMHQCDDGSHGCDKGPGGICLKVGGDFNEWACGCNTTG